MSELKPCPFCGGYPKLSFAETDFYGRNFQGDKKSKYRVQLICRKCYARGKPIKTDYLINCNPHESYFESRTWLLPDIREKNSKMIEPWVTQAIEAWNRRAE